MLVYLATSVAADVESAGDVAAGDSLGVESPDIFYNGSLGTAIFFRVPYLLALPLVKRVGKRRGGTYLTVAGPVTIGFRSQPWMGCGPGHLG
ncbi:hypothetical protein GCM10010980_24480 [Corynebacterium marinum]|nr:hypothetical protein GCM10010980_24480 [Corynebacterium marinum]